MEVRIVPTQPWKADKVIQTQQGQEGPLPSCPKEMLPVAHLGARLDEILDLVTYTLSAPTLFRIGATSVTGRPPQNRLEVSNRLQRGLHEAGR